MAIILRRIVDRIKIKQNAFLLHLIILSDLHCIQMFIYAAYIKQQFFPFFCMILLTNQNIGPTNTKLGTIDHHTGVIALMGR